VGGGGGGEKARLEVDAAEDSDEKSDNEEVEMRRWWGGGWTAMAASESESSFSLSNPPRLFCPWSETHQSLRTDRYEEREMGRERQLRRFFQLKKRLGHG